MILFVDDMENKVQIQKKEINEMEDYLDDLLLRVMEMQPKLLHNLQRYRSQECISKIKD